MMQRSFHEFVFIIRPLAAAGLERVANHLQCVGRAKWLKYLAATMGLRILFCRSICWHSFVLYDSLKFGAGSGMVVSDIFFA